MRLVESGAASDWQPGAGCALVGLSHMRPDSALRAHPQFGVLVANPAPERCWWRTVLWANV